MTITEVNITAIPCQPDARHVAFADVVFDGDFAVHGFVVVRRRDGTLTVNYPDKPAQIQCCGCGRSIPIMSRYCYSCGAPQPDRLSVGVKPRLFHNIAHPINRDARSRIEGTILRAYEAEVGRAEGATR